MQKQPAIGDILIIDRKLYKHYAVYIGNGKVIHYSASDSDFGFDIAIRESNLNSFAGKYNFIIGQFTNSFLQNHKIFSPEETVARARSRLGEQKYNLVTNNCEHFASWCKTGVSQSNQVNNVFSKIDDVLHLLLCDDGEINFADVFICEAEFQKLYITPSTTVDPLTFDSVRRFFMQDKIIKKIKGNANILPIVVREKNKITLCLYNKNDNTTDSDYQVYYAKSLDTELQQAFGNKNMLVLQ